MSRRWVVGSTTLLVLAGTVVFLTCGPASPASQLAQAFHTSSATHTQPDAPRAAQELEKSNALCGNCYKMNRCSELAPDSWSEEKQRCLCEGIGPFAEKPCTVQCAKSGPSPVADVKLMPCQTTACNKCSQKCGGGQYANNAGTIGNWEYSPTYTSGATWSRGYCKCMKSNCWQVCEDVDLFRRVDDCDLLPS